MFGLKTILKKSTYILAASIFFVLVFGFSLFVGASENVDGVAVNCPFGGHSVSICKANPLEHIQELQSMFVSLPGRDMLPTLIFSLLSLLALGLSLYKAIIKSWLSYRPIGRSILSGIFIPNPLKDAFSNGILNPKIYHLA